MSSRIVISSVLAALCALVLVGCEIPASVRLGAGPSFSLGGGGRLVSFTVWGPRPGRKVATPLDSKGLMWCIEPINPPSGSFVATMDIAYGSVPMGYVQKFPRHGLAVPVAAGHVYAFTAETTGAPGVNGFFYMGPNGPIRINVPGLCESSSVGDVEPVRCGTNQPYVEPTDLEKFVEENRVK